MSVYTLGWLVPLLPLLGWLLSHLAIMPRRTARICLVFCGLAAALAVYLLGYRIAHRTDAPHESVITFWQMMPTETGTFASAFSPNLGVRIDALSTVLMAAAATVSVAVQWHGMVWMRADAELRRFYQVVAVLTFAVLGVIAGPTLFQLWFLGAVAAIAAHLLTAHWWTGAEIAGAARRLYLHLHLSDAALMLAVVFVFVKLGRHAAALPPAPGSDASDPLSFGVLAGEWHAGATGAIPGVGMRTLALAALLLTVAGGVRALQVPFQGWLLEAAGAPPATIALLASLLAGSGVLLLLRVDPLLTEVPHALTALALVGAVSAVVAAAGALLQGDIVRRVMLLCAAQLGLIVAGLGLGGYSVTAYGLVVFILTTPLVMLVVANLVGVYRTQEVDGIRGAWPRMRWNAAALGVWAAAAAGASLLDYGVLAALLRHRAPGGPTVAPVAAAIIGVVLVAGMVLLGFGAVRLLLGVCSGQPPRRRGLQPERIAEREPRLRRAVAGLAILAAATVVGTGVVPAWSLGRFVFPGARPQPLGWDPIAAALGLAVVLAGAGGAWAGRSGAGWWPARAPRRIPRPLRPAAAAIAAPAATLARVVDRPLALAGGLLAATDAGVVDAITAATGDGVTVAGELAGRGRSPRLTVQLAAGLLVTLLLTAGMALGATGHWPFGR